jgi:hypothetical protein
MIGWKYIHTHQANQEEKIAKPKISQGFFLLGPSGITSKILFFVTRKSYQNLLAQPRRLGVDDARGFFNELAGGLQIEIDATARRGRAWIGLRKGRWPRHKRQL